MRTKKAVKAVVEQTGDVDGGGSHPDLGGDLDGTAGSSLKITQYKTFLAKMVKNKGVPKKA